MTGTSSLPIQKMPSMPVALYMSQGALNRGRCIKKKTPRTHKTECKLQKGRYETK